MRTMQERGVPEQMQNNEFKPRFASSIYDSFAWIPVGMSLFCCIALLIVRLTVVSGISMNPTLQHGDLMVTSGLLYQPARGDIVVLTKEGFFFSQPIVKRIIAVGGDNININFDLGQVWVNGQLLHEPYIAEATTRSEGLPFPQTVPNGCIFVMGDNRSHSDDSRDPELGMVDIRCIIGRVYVVLPTGQIVQKMKGRSEHV